MPDTNLSLTERITADNAREWDITLQIQAQRRAFTESSKVEKAAERQRASEQGEVDSTWLALHHAKIALAELEPRRNAYDLQLAEVARLTALLDEARAKGFVAYLETAKQREAEIQAKTEADYQESRRVSVRDGLAYQDHVRGVRLTPQEGTPAVPVEMQICQGCGASVPANLASHRNGNRTLCICNIAKAKRAGISPYEMLSSETVTVQQLRDHGFSKEMDTL